MYEDITGKTSRGGRDLLTRFCSGIFAAFLALFPLSGGPAIGAQLKITQVHIDFEAETIDIVGEHFDFGPGPLTVRLGDLVPGDITDACAPIVSATLISCDLSAIGLPEDADYLLRVSNGKGQSQADEYDLTVRGTNVTGNAGPEVLTFKFEVNVGSEVSFLTYNTIAFSTHCQSRPDSKFVTIFVTVFEELAIREAQVSLARAGG